MAVDFREKERLLPSRLLNGGDILSENRSNTQNGSGNDSISNGFGSSGSSSSCLSSSFGSELGSTETESDEDDDFIAELTRQMADYMLEEEDNENGAANGASQDLKYLCGLPGSGCNSDSTDHHSEILQASSDDQTRAIQFYKLEDQPFIKHQDHGCWGRRVKTTMSIQQFEPKLQLQPKSQHYMRNRGGRADAVSAGGFGPSATAWPPLQPRRQQQVGSGSGMRAVFLGGPGSRSGSCGTGVFLPHAIDPREVRKKPGCSTVLIPARVMQALQLHFEDMNARSQSNNGFKDYPLHRADDVAMARNTTRDMHLQEKRQSQSRTRLPDVNLPKEWTY